MKIRWWIVCFFFCFPLFGGKKYKLFFGYEEGGVVITKREYALFAKLMIASKKGRLEQNYMYKQSSVYSDKLEKIQKEKVMQVRRHYDKYTQIILPWGEETPVKGVFFLAGTEWRIQRKSQRQSISTLLKGKVPAAASQEVFLDDLADILAESIRKRSPFEPGERWEASRNEILTLLKHWEPGSRCLVKFHFVKKVFFQGYRCAKVGIYLRILGRHKILGNAKLEQRGYLYYSLEYGFPVYLELKGKITGKIKQVAPRGQVLYGETEGPVKVVIEKEYLPPEK